MNRLRKPAREQGRYIQYNLRKFFRALGSRTALAHARACAPLVLLGLLFTACSTRLQYEPSPIQTSANALNINTATADELEKLPGIGLKTAEAIVEFRKANGPFRRVENLMLIKGVSENRFAELRPYIKTE